MSLGKILEFSDRVKLVHLAAILGVVIWTISPASAQIKTDPGFRPVVENPAFESGSGPLVLIDQAHNNFHTANGRFKAFADLLRLDGYRVGSFLAPFSAESLHDADVLVIVNALAETNVRNWALPIHSAFTTAEIDAVSDWVSSGGALLLIADHMPFPGAVAGLASRLGIEMHNGYAFTAGSPARIRFSLADDSLRPHPIVRGRDADEAIDFVLSFLGHAFAPRPGVVIEPLLVLATESVLVLPQKASEFNPETPRTQAGGMLQGATLQYGAGRVVVLGEAAMVAALLSGPDKETLGMNHPEATQNQQFTLNIVRWLAGVLDTR